MTIIARRNIIAVGAKPFMQQRTVRCVDNNFVRTRLSAREIRLAPKITMIRGEVNDFFASQGDKSIFTRGDVDRTVDRRPVRQWKVENASKSDYAHAKSRASGRTDSRANPRRESNLLRNLRREPSRLELDPCVSAAPRSTFYPACCLAQFFRR